MMPSKMVIATILSSAARAIAIFLLSLLLKLNDDLYWVLPWLRQMTIRIEVVFFIFLIQCGGSSSRGAPSIHVASLSPTRVYCFHFNCAIVVAAAASKAAAGGMVEAGSNAYILVPCLAAALVPLGAVAHSTTARILLASLQCSLVNCCWYSDQICESSFFKRAQRNLAPLCNRFNSMLCFYKNNRKNAFT